MTQPSEWSAESVRAAVRPGVPLARLLRVLRGTLAHDHRLAFRVAHQLRSEHPAAADDAARELQGTLAGTPPGPRRAPLVAVYLAACGLDRIAELVQLLLEVRGAEDLLPDVAAALCVHGCHEAVVPAWVRRALPPPTAEPDDWERFAAFRMRATWAFERMPELRPALVCLAARWPILPAHRLVAEPYLRQVAAPLAVFRLLRSLPAAVHAERDALREALREHRTRGRCARPHCPRCASVAWLAVYSHAFAELAWNWRHGFEVGHGNGDALAFLAQAHGAHFSTAPNPRTLPTLLPDGQQTAAHPLPSAARPDDPAWPAGWLLDLVPTRWFPAHRHDTVRELLRIRVTPGGQPGELAVSAAGNDGWPVRVATCTDPRCRLLARWGDRQARARWPATYGAAVRLLADRALTLPVADAEDACAWAYLGDGHADFPAAALLSVVLRRKCPIQP